MVRLVAEGVRGRRIARFDAALRAARRRDGELVRRRDIEARAVGADGVGKVRRNDAEPLGDLVERGVSAVRPRYDEGEVRRIRRDVFEVSLNPVVREGVVLVPNDKRVADIDLGGVDRRCDLDGIGKDRECRYAYRGRLVRCPTRAKFDAGRGVVGLIAGKEDVDKVPELVGTMDKSGDQERK